MTTHESRSPSKRHRWSVCAGSVREEARYPDTRGQAASDGTHTHFLLERCVQDGLRDPMELVGQKLTSQDGEFTVDQDHAMRVKVAIDYLRERGGQCIAEEKVDPAPLLGRSDCAGTVDVQRWNGTTYEIIDYKDGMGFVDPVNNPQLELYAIGALAKPEFEQYFTHISMTIIQPKNAFKGLAPIQSWTITVADLKSRIPKVIAEAAATDDPNAPLTPGESQCKFCKHKGACSALAGTVAKEVGLMFGPVADMATSAAEKNPTEMSVDQIRQVLEAAPLVRQFIEGVESEAQRRLESGQSIPGFKLVRGRGSRSWGLPDEEIAEKLIKSFGIPKGSVYTMKLVSPAQVEKLKWSKRDGSQDQLSERQIRRLDAEYVTHSSGKLQVVPESDAREAVIMDASEHFAPVTPVVPDWLQIPSWLA